ncbi:DUF4149 domain-containing protein [Mitsuaria sp. WAJ17]|uniref:DUF4149 domain-containing protein n=1 Tax=Mitsuaria sp. WAJ17 TaxID=2761452 RepID=UPI001600F928|nr:DUF4149 domain-containing protein [Mitsuaria sp. WAJ17]MBB2485568.1 DUF4149 domain-containing protein [Mitsuaria sp. WAJ17]
MLIRVRALLAALWGGFLLCVAGVAAPVAFGVLARPEAGHYVGRLFELDAQLGLLLGLLLVMMERRVQREAEASRITTPELLLPLGALFCVVLGYYGLQPLMAQARAGQGALSFGALHGLSSAVFAVKLVLVLGLAWRTSRR